MARRLDYKLVQRADGLTFATALFARADELALPALKLSKAPTDVPVSQHLYGFASHLLYGATEATVVRAVRKAT